MIHSNSKGPGEPNEENKFKPERYIEHRNGTPYMPLKWRLAWLRAEHPRAEVKTRLVSMENNLAIFRAEISLPEGGKASGWGARRDPFAAENDKTVSDPNLSFLTEAENQALARALSILGYGVEYVTDFDLPHDAEAIPLPDDSQPEADETGIEVPLTGLAGPKPEPAPPATGEVRGNISLPGPTSTPSGEEETAPENTGDENALSTGEEDEEGFGPGEEHEEEGEGGKGKDEENTEGAGEEEQKSSQPATNTPIPIRRTIQEESSRFNTTPNRTRISRPEFVPPEPPAPLPTRAVPVRRPGPGQAVTPDEPAPPPPVPITSQYTNSGVEDRLKGITDSRMIIVIKQIFNEARRLHNLSEDAIDRNSIKRFGVPVNRLSLEQAEEYLERIKNAPRQPRK